VSQEKRLFLALGLCVLVIFGFQALFPPPPPKKQVPKPTPGAVKVEPPVVAPGPANPDTAAVVPGDGAQPKVGDPLPPPPVVKTPPVDFVSGRIHAEIVCTGAAVGKTWLEGVPASPGATATHESTPGSNPPDGALGFLKEVQEGSPGAFSVWIASNELPLIPDLDKRPWERVHGPENGPVHYRTETLKKRRDGMGIVIDKKFIRATDPDAWHFVMQLEIRNQDPELEGRRFELRARGAALLHEAEGPRDRILGLTKKRNTDPTETNGDEAYKRSKENEPLVLGGDIEWAATVTTYFAAVIDPPEAQEGDPPLRATVVWESLTPSATEKIPHPLHEPSPVVSIPLTVPKADTVTRFEFTVFIGPVAGEIKIAEKLTPVMDREAYKEYRPARNPSWFPIEIISQGMLLVLKGFQSLVASWGLSIILLTVLVRGFLFPLSRKQLKSTIEYSKKMQKIKPKIDALKAKHGDDRRKISEEQFKLMKEHGVPLMPGGCLLTFLQLPIWIALYNMLQRSYELRHASFLWIPDLSQAEHIGGRALMPFIEHVPFIPNGFMYLNVLPLAMTATWFFASKATMTPPADEQQAQMQKMMQWMPFIMLLFPGFYDMPAGLCLYITVSSTWGIVESRIIRKGLGAA